MAKFDPGWEGYPVWYTGLPSLAGHPTYHVNVIKLKWEIIWIGGLPHLHGPPPPCKQALTSLWNVLKTVFRFHSVRRKATWSSQPSPGAPIMSKGAAVISSVGFSFFFLSLQHAVRKPDWSLRLYHPSLHPPHENCTAAMTVCLKVFTLAHALFQRAAFMLLAYFKGKDS